MTTTPRLLSDRDEWTVQDHIDYARTGELPVNPAWIKQKAQALEEAGLESDADTPAEIDEMSAAQHDTRKYGDRR
jgi:hypothetical protein